MNLKKSLVAFAVLALSSAPIGVVVHATESGEVQTMAQSSLFENEAFGVTVKIAHDKLNRSDVSEAKIELVRDSAQIQKLVQHLPVELDGELYDLLLVELLDKDGKPLQNTPAEISVKKQNLRGELEKVLFLTPDGEYKTLPVSTKDDKTVFQTDQLNKFALVYKKDQNVATEDTKQKRIDEIVSFSESTTESVEKVVELSQEKPSKPTVTNVVAIADQQATQEVNKPIENNNQITVVKPEKPKEEVPSAPEPPVTPPTVEEPIQPVVPEEPVTPYYPVPAGFFASEAEAIATGQSQGDTPFDTYIAGYLPNGVPYYGIVRHHNQQPQLDPLADDDGDGVTNGTEMSVGTNPKDKASKPPVKEAKYEKAEYFTSKEQAEAFAKEYHKGQPGEHEVTQKTDSNGRVYFDVTFKEPEATKPEVNVTVNNKVDVNVTVNGEEVKPVEKTIDSTTEEQSVTEAVAESEQQAPVTKEENQPLPEGVSEDQRATHEGFLANGYKYVGQEDNQSVYHKESKTPAPLAYSVPVEPPVDPTQNSQK